MEPKRSSQSGDRKKKQLPIRSPVGIAAKDRRSAQLVCVHFVWQGGTDREGFWDTTLFVGN
jgi:hypothetical protein